MTATPFRLLLLEDNAGDARLVQIALPEIERGRGTAYNPIVADACLKLFLEKGYAIPARSR